MKKSLLLTLVLVFGLTGIGSAAAPIDIPANHWAYDAVNKLVADGIIDGYSNLKGDKNLTRYEFAVVVAKAIEKADKATAEEKTLIDKLAAEYKAELGELGVHLRALDDKTSAIQIDGVARVRFDQQSDGHYYDDKHFNIDLNITYQIDKEWAIKTESEWARPFDQSGTGNTAGRNALTRDPSNWSGPGANGAMNSQMEQLYVTGPIVRATVKIGRHNYNPVYGLVFDTRIAGWEATFGKTIKTTLSTGKTDEDYDFNGVDLAWTVGKNTNVKAGCQITDTGSVKTKYTSVGFDTKVVGDFLVTAAVAKSDQNTNNKAYFAQVQYKAANSAVVGSGDIFVSYRKVPKNTVYYTTKDLEDRILDIDFKGARVGLDYVPAKNIKFTAWYMTGKDATTNSTDIKVYRSQLEFYF
jgi:hypothetical protein